MDSSPMRLIFCGTPQFAVPTLERLLAEGYAVDLVVTNPDEPSGRGYQRRSPPVKEAAKKAGLEVFQPPKLKDQATQDRISEVRPDAVVVVAYGHIIPPWMIELPRFGCINLHASLLPKYRGAAPIQWALIRGEPTTGVTTMKIDRGLDTGDILLQRAVPVQDDDTTETLSDHLSTIGSELTVETLRGLERGEIAPRPQDHGLATLAPMLKKDDGRIDWKSSAEELWRRVRGLRPWPGAFAIFRGKTLHIWNAAPAALTTRDGLEPGALVAERGRLFVVCGGGAFLELKELQLEGRKRLSSPEFLNGVRLRDGERLG